MQTDGGPSTEEASATSGKAKPVYPSISRGLRPTSAHRGTWNRARPEASWTLNQRRVYQFRQAGRRCSNVYQRASEWPQSSPRGPHMTIALSDGILGPAGRALVACWGDRPRSGCGAELRPAPR